MLRAFGHRVAMCCDMLPVVGSSLKLVKFEPTTSNMSQHVATRWPNACNMLLPTMLRYIALACCDRLAGALGCSASTGAIPFRVLSRKNMSGDNVLCKNWYLLEEEKATPTKRNLSTS